MNMYTVTNMKEEGFVAKLFLPKNYEAQSAVVVLGGSAGGFNEPVALGLSQERIYRIGFSLFWHRRPTKIP